MENKIINTVTDKLIANFIYAKIAENCQKNGDIMDVTIEEFFGDDTGKLLLTTVKEFAALSCEKQKEACIEAARDAFGVSSKQAVIISAIRNTKLVTDDSAPEPAPAQPIKLLPWLEGKDGMHLIEYERWQQINVYGYNAEYDAKLHANDLYSAASAYEFAADNIEPEHRTTPPEVWPWEAAIWRHAPENPVNALVKAGALYLADADIWQSLDTSRAVHSTEKAKECATKIDGLLGIIDK